MRSHTRGHVRLTRRFHVSELLAVVRRDLLGGRGGAGALVDLYCHMAGRSPLLADDDPFLDIALDYLDDFAAAVLAAYPALGAYAGQVAPPAEFRDAWYRSREREFGAYLKAPLLPDAHPLRRAAPAGDATGDVDNNGAGGVPVDTTVPAATSAARHFHVTDLLALVMREPGVSYRSGAGVYALLRAMGGHPGGPDLVYASVRDEDVRAGRYDAFRTALLDAYPALGAYATATAPPREFHGVWVRRREREFGRYHAVSRLTPPPEVLLPAAPPPAAPLPNAPPAGPRPRARRGRPASAPGDA